LSSVCLLSAVFVSAGPASPDIYTLSLHDALPILHVRGSGDDVLPVVLRIAAALGCRAVDYSTAEFLTGAEDVAGWHGFQGYRDRDRKSTRLNSSHVKISYAVFCLKKKKKDAPGAG